MTAQNQTAAATDDDVSWLFKALDRRARRPVWLADEWRQAQGCDETSTEKIFQVDFATWLVYRNAKAKAFGQGHYAGRAALRDKIRQLEDEPVSRKLEIAQEVYRTMDHELRQRLMSWEEKTQGRKRIRDSDDSMPTYKTALETRESSAASPQPLASTLTPRAATIDATYFLSDLRNNDTLLDACISETKRLLPDYMFNAVIKRHSATRTTMVAGVTMTYYFHSDDCLMTLEILNSKVERIAHQLFGVQLEIESGVRYAVFGMAKVTPIPKLVLEGCDPNAIEQMFGEVVSRAVRASLVYQNDATTLSEHTQAVSMLISGKADEAAILIIRMALLEGMDIAVQLFRLGRPNINA